MSAADPQRYSEPPPSWANDYRFESFDAFEQLIFKYIVPWMTSPERYAETARALLDERLEENVSYMEFSFAGIALELTGLDMDEVAQAIKESAPPEMEVRLFIGLHHAGFARNHSRYLAQILDSPHIDGIDLHGPEEFPLQDWAKEFWPATRQAGKLAKAHAGELSGPGSIREVIEDLGVTKVQHGINAIQDPSVLAVAIEAGASFDVCPISNIKLNNVPSMDQHPLLQLEQAGIKCTLNTDDPFIFGNRLVDDYQAIAEGLQLTPEQIATFAKNSFITADIAAESKNKAIAEIDALVEAYVSEQSLETR